MEKRQVDVDHQTQQHEMALEKVEKAEEDVRIVKEDAKKLEEKMNALKIIREIKLHSDTVKKIYHYGYRPGEMAQTTGEGEIAQTTGEMAQTTGEEEEMVKPQVRRERCHKPQVRRAR